MSVLFENQNYGLYLNLMEKRDGLFEKLKELVGDDKELTPAEDRAFVRICDELDNVHFRIKNIFEKFLDETDDLLLSV